MPAYNFTVFIEKVESGEKRQTIRPERKRRTQPGDILYLYTGMRTKQARRLKPPVKCRNVIPIGINIEEAAIWIRDIPNWEKVYTHKEIIKLAFDDGFDKLEDFWKFFSRYDTETLQNKMEIITW